jgi:glycosyltransferase involved in cell wall biosynthesis
MKLLYLTFFESVTHNGLYETQVKQLLLKLRAQYTQDIVVSCCAIMPAIEIGRTEIVAPFLTHRHELAALRNEFQEYGICATFCFLPVMLLKRWCSQLPLPILGMLLGLSVPALFYRIAGERPDIIHCRSYAATLIALLAKLVCRNIKIVFDARGFWPEEGVVANRWKEQSLTFRFWKCVEAYMLRRSDKVIALSDSFASRITGIVREADCAVIYASADVHNFQRARQFRNRRRRELGLQGKTVLVYNGSLHAWHDPWLLAQVYKAISRFLCHTRLLVITAYNRAKLQAVFRSAGLQINEFLIVAAEPGEVPSYLVAGDYGLVPLKEMREPTAMTVVADTMIGTKVAEYLACGMPIIVNKNVRGLKALMDRYRLGIVFDSKNLAALGQSIKCLSENYGEYQRDCESVAEHYLSLEQTARSYYHVYEEIMLPRIRDDAVKTATV